MISAVSVSCLEKQKEGKKRMRQVGNVEIPQEGIYECINWTTK
ncbi:MAG: hypothetical protein ACLR2O_00315 [Coprococcus sp.]